MEIVLRYLASGRDRLARPSGPAGLGCCGDHLPAVRQIRTVLTDAA